MFLGMGNRLSKFSLLSLGLISIILVVSLGIVNPLPEAQADAHPPALEDMTTGDYYEGGGLNLFSAQQVDCNFDSNVIAWVNNNGGTVEDYQVIDQDLIDRGFTVRIVNLSGPIPACIIKLVVAYGAASCRGDLDQLQIKL